ncbi:gamma-glutamylcysteine synthetase [Artemisia annua]|uniref:Gamma-glutamylcysteine synthetase n=1 Tax=Artemisia annua TaxID=35608 RepID=A0A2U1QBW3_ARTAN|nr:gamma-glutamylcysteine synthetase [Artemisia annua]
MSPSLRKRGKEMIQFREFVSQEGFDHASGNPIHTCIVRHIAVRLGWVPLQPLPESLQLHLLELFSLGFSLLTGFLYKDQTKLKRMSNERRVQGFCKCIFKIHWLQVHISGPDNSTAASFTQREELSSIFLEFISLIFKTPVIMLSINLPLTVFVTAETRVPNAWSQNLNRRLVFKVSYDKKDTRTLLSLVKSMEHQRADASTIWKEFTTTEDVLQQGYKAIGADGATSISQGNQFVAADGTCKEITNLFGWLHSLNSPYHKGDVDTLRKWQRWWSQRSRVQCALLRNASSPTLPIGAYVKIKYHKRFMFPQYTDNMYNHSDVQDKMFLDIPATWNGVLEDMSDGVEGNEEYHVNARDLTTKKMFDGLLCIPDAFEKINESTQEEVILLGHSDLNTRDKLMQVTIVYNHFGVGLIQRMQRIVTEHEKFGFDLKTLHPMTYEQVAHLLNAISERFNWEKHTIQFLITDTTTAAILFNKRLPGIMMLSCNLSAKTLFVLKIKMQEDMYKRLQEYNSGMQN